MSKPSEFDIATTEQDCLISGSIEGILKIKDFFMDNFSSTSMKTLSSSSTAAPANITSTTAPVYHFKILVPAAAAGRIIGKGGTTIAQLQKDAGARVKMSKASEFYPGTTERVCLISGSIEGILKINDFFMDNFSSTSMKILVPNSTAGMIIGKGGSYIKQIKEESGAYVQISQKCTDFSLPERCVTVVGELENIRKACLMILNKIVEDVGSAFRDIRTSSTTTSLFSLPSTTTTSPTSSTSALSSSSSSSLTPILAAGCAPIARVLGGGNGSGSISGTGGPLASLTPSPSLSSNTNHGNYSIQQHQVESNNVSFPFSNTNSANNVNSAHNIVKPLSPDHLNCPTVSLSPPPISNSSVPFAASTTSSTNGGVLAPSSVASEMNSAQIIETIKLVLRVSGYGEDAVSEISSAMSTLASYGVLGVGLGLL